MLKITAHIFLHESEIQLSFIRAPGPGGQNVNKVATAVQLRFNIPSSASLTEEVKARLLSLLGKRVTLQGDLLIKASRYRTQERNKQDALERLQELIRQAAIPRKKRRKTKPSFSSVQRRLTEKKIHSRSKALRSKLTRSDD